MKEKNIKTAIIISMIAILLLVGYLESRKKTNNIRNNAVHLMATIKDLHGCFRTSNCIDFEYVWKDRVYTGTSGVSLKMANFCNRRNECKGLQFKITVNKKNPDDCLVSLDTLFVENDDIYVIFE